MGASLPMFAPGLLVMIQVPIRLSSLLKKKQLGGIEILLLCVMAMWCSRWNLSLKAAQKKRSNQKWMSLRKPEEINSLLISQALALLLSALKAILQESSYKMQICKGIRVQMRR